MIQLVWKKNLGLMLAIAGGCFYSNATEGEAEETPQNREIRSFDIDTLSAMGREIYRHDQLAWIATDLLLKEVDMEAYGQSGAAGWVVDDESGYPRVRFLRNAQDSFEAAYDILFKEGAEPVLVEAEDSALSERQLATAHAFQSALNALVEGGHPWCGGSPNRVALPDPDGEGFLVYFLRPKSTAEEIPIGGHYRITVSGDGKTVEWVDQLFASCLSLSRDQGVPEGGESVGLYMSHVVSSTPIETHVFLSMQEKLPFAVICGESQMWSVEGGRITAFNTEE